MDNLLDFGKFKLIPHGITLIGAVALTYLMLRKPPPVKYTTSIPAELRAVTWNVAAINNNPFEYWITHSDANYNKLMRGVQTFIDAPGDKDITVEKVFTPQMYAELAATMRKAGWTGVDTVDAMWNNDFSKRNIISGFVKDGKLGKKRLASMPDRITNTINSADGEVVLRPTVINCYEGELSTGKMWWSAWKMFMFEKSVAIKGKDGTVKQRFPFDMLSKISRTKYPDVTEEEEAVSLPLQTLCCAIFDSILVHMMNEVYPQWQPLPRTMEILERYDTADVIFLQEVSMAMASLAQTTLGDRFDIHLPAAMDPVRDQNSIILTNKVAFPNEAKEVTDVLSRELDNAEKKAPVALGDLFGISIKDNAGFDYILASFHGDTNGLATIPVVASVHAAAESDFPTHRLVMGLDANTYDSDKKSLQNIQQFADFATGIGLGSPWGPKPDVSKITTFNARTFMQPQLNKAVRYEDKDTQGDRNLKDFILFKEAQFSCSFTARDNTGDEKFIENMVIPSLAFPSDHCILEARLSRKSGVKRMADSESE